MTTPAGTSDFDSASPWLPGDQNLLEVAGQVVSSAAPYVTAALPVARGAYVVAIDALYSVSALIPFLQVDMVWTDSSTGLVIGHEQWVVPGTSAAPAAANSLVIGRGPTKADTLTITVTNYDTNFTASVDLSVYQSSRAITRDDWRNVSFAAIPSWTISGSACAGLIVATKAAAGLNAGISVQRIHALYCGQAQLAMTNSAGQAITWQMQAIEPSLGVASGPIINSAAFSAVQYETTVTLPRYPVLMIVTNNGASTSVVGWTVTAQEFSS